jgi:XRE family transcriptional regulator, aerobic/anaerobic benzoate catabolism transcriptional regulator
MARELTSDEQRFLADLARRVRTLRARHGMSRRALASASGLSERYIAQLEAGDGNVSVLLLQRVARAMGQPITALLDDHDRSPEEHVLGELLKSASRQDRERVRAMLAEGRPREPAPPPRVALIGLRGAGKSTLGKMAAETLGWRFLELNREIEREAGLSIAEVFSLYGQEGYRRFERRCLDAVSKSREPMILATAGGIVAEPVTFDRLLSSFQTIWLKAQPEEHMRRVREQGDLRPMGRERSAMDELRAILESREPLYGRARARLDTAGLSVADAASRLVGIIRDICPAASAEAA